jgi:hypothetical protein
LFSWALVEYGPVFLETDSSFMIWVSAFVGSQIWLMSLQNCFAAHVFIPKKFRAHRFDYSSETPPPHTDCLICLDEIRPDEFCMATPCHHYYHGSCLRMWMSSRAICPICRRKLPPARSLGPIEIGEVWLNNSLCLNANILSSHGILFCDPPIGHANLKFQLRKFHHPWKPLILPAWIDTSATISISRLLECLSKARSTSADNHDHQGTMWSRRISSIHVDYDHMIG